MSTASVITAALGGSGSQLLRDLTNQGPAASINSTVLDSAVSMAEGRFRVLTGVAPDASLDWHVAPLIAGVLWALELLKARDSSMIRTRDEAFKFACMDIRRIATMAAQTSSTLTPSTERAGSMPDMDRQSPIIKGLTEGVGRSHITTTSPSD